MRDVSRVLGQGNGAVGASCDEADQEPQVSVEPSSDM